jgi:hypothetical protein
LHQLQELQQSTKISILQAYDPDIDTLAMAYMTIEQKLQQGIA